MVDSQATNIHGLLVSQPQNSTKGDTGTTVIVSCDSNARSQCKSIQNGQWKWWYCSTSVSAELMRCWVRSDAMTLTSRHGWQDSYLTTPKGGFDDFQHQDRDSSPTCAAHFSLLSSLMFHQYSYSAHCTIPVRPRYSLCMTHVVYFCAKRDSRRNQGNDLVRVNDNFVLENLPRIRKMCHSSHLRFGSCHCWIVVIRTGVRLSQRKLIFDVAAGYFHTALLCLYLHEVLHQTPKLLWLASSSFYPIFNSFPEPSQT